jgi:integral membrane protein
MINIIKVFKIVALLEGLSFLLLLLIAMPLKYYAGHPEATQFLGMAHGVLFVGFCLLLGLIMIKYSISLKIGIIGFISSLIPFGPFLYHPFLKKYLANFEDQ